MPRVIQLAIPQPCPESWAAMTPTATGRHCAACQKTVVDFTLKTDAEILAYFARAAGASTCGRLSASQLERPLQAAALAVPPTRWRVWLAAAVAVWGLREAGSLAATAQAPAEWRARYWGGPVPVAPIDKKVSVERVEPASAISSVLLRGVVLDSLTGDKLPGVTVLLPGTTIGASSAEDGSFALEVPAAYALPAGIRVQINSIGYVTQQRVLTAASAASLQTFRLQQDVKGLMGIVVVPPRAMPPAPWHPRRFYYWGKYWLIRPFRRG